MSVGRHKLDIQQKVIAASLNKLVRDVLQVRNLDLQDNSPLLTAPSIYRVAFYGICVGQLHATQQWRTEKRLSTTTTGPRTVAQSRLVAKVYYPACHVSHLIVVVNDNDRSKNNIAISAGTEKYMLIVADVRYKNIAIAADTRKMSAGLHFPQISRGYFPWRRGAWNLHCCYFQADWAHDLR